MTSAAGTDCGLGIEARCRALLSEGEAAERLYRESVERLARIRLRPDLARAHLLYGEWLRRERRRTEVCEQLRTAHSMLKAMGVEAFAERARDELQATGKTARKRPAAMGIDKLTAHEAQIARLARDGLTNLEIGARLFLSARTHGPVPPGQHLRQTRYQLPQPRPSGTRASIRRSVGTGCS